MEDAASAASQQSTVTNSGEANLGVKVSQITVNGFVGTCSVGNYEVRTGRGRNGVGLRSKLFFDYC